MKSLKKTVALILAFALSLSFTAGATDLFQTTSIPVMIACTGNELEITASGQAQIDALTEGNPDVDRVKVDTYLEYKAGGTWKTYDSSYWTKSSSGTYVFDSHIKYVLKGYNYRVRTVHTAYKGSQSETVTSYTSTKYYG